MLKNLGISVMCLYIVCLMITSCPAYGREIHAGTNRVEFHEPPFYILGPKDVIQITVNNHPELSGKVTVMQDGTITIPLTGDSIRVDGLTSEEAAGEVGRVIDKYAKMPRVTVNITDYNSRVYYVFGEVRRPGKFPMSGSEVRLRDALIESGLLQKTAALNRVHVVTPQSERPEYTVIDARNILYKGRLKDNVVLKPGDVVYVPNTLLDKTSFVLSQILSPMQRSRDITDNAESW